MKLIGRWLVELPDESHAWEPDEYTNADERLLEGEIPGFTFDTWASDIDARRADACEVLVWMLRRKAGNQSDRTSVLFPIRRLDLTELCWTPDCKNNPEPTPTGEWPRRNMCPEHRDVNTPPSPLAGDEQSEPATSEPSSPVTASDPGTGNDSPAPTS